ncbi:threonine/serine exporter family protein [Enemella evansiae]|uniref:threonine/serine ThrE exporter family protein n=1 Tax=Enemella evansiae TaxID=2016499 RepID=UPI0011810A8A|nr:threonine/serine exporter family protein [Enemella evansiae]
MTEVPQPPEDPGIDLVRRARDRRLLAYFGLALIAGGQPAHEAEEDVRQVAATLGHSDCQVAALPTSISVALTGGAPATVEVLRSSLTLDQLAAVHELRQRILDGSTDPDTALVELTSLRRIPRRYGRWGMPLGGLLVAAGIAAIMQPDVTTIVFAAVASQLVIALLLLARRHPLIAPLLPTVAAFLVSVPAFWLAGRIVLTGPLLAILPPLAVLLPGSLLVTGMSELAAGAMVAGASRLAHGAVKLLLFALGVVAAIQLVRPPEALIFSTGAAFRWPHALAGILAVALGILLLESVSPRLWGWVILVLLATFLAQVLAGTGRGVGSALGGFAGAVVASAGATLVELARPALPRLVVFLPSFWLLVPGTIGLQSITRSQASEFVAGPSLTQVGLLVLAIALGLLVGATLVRPVQRAVARRRARVSP